MLYTHCGASQATLAEIRTSYRVPTLDELREQRKSESAGNRWRPIHHADLIDQITLAAEARGLGIARQSFALSEDSHDIFGFMQFDGFDLGRSDMAPVLGFRSSNMQRFRLLGVSGSRVFICDNGAIVGEFVFGMKHTTGNVEEMSVGIDEGLGKWEDQSKRLKRVVEAMESMELSQRDADHLLMEGFRDKVFALGKLREIDEIYRAYENPAHDHYAAFAPRNAWSLYNAVTEAAKGYRVRVGETALKGFPRTLARVGGFTDLMDVPVDEETGISLN